MKKISLLLLLSSFLSGCVLFHGYAPPVQQGNAFSSKQTRQVHVGMTQNEVLALLGSPVLTNTFRDNRWDFVYTYQEQGHRFQEKKFIVSFKNGRVINIRKDLNPNMHPVRLTKNHVSKRQL